MATADGEFYRDKQDERDGQDTVELMRSINVSCAGQASTLSLGGCAGFAVVRWQRNAAVASCSGFSSFDGFRTSGSW